MGHTRKLKIAAAQYPLDELKNLAEYEAKITRWVEETVGHGAGLLVFPEYGAMELAGIAVSHIVTGEQDVYIQVFAKDLHDFADLMLTKVQAVPGVAIT